MTRPDLAMVQGFAFLRVLVGGFALLILLETLVLLLPRSSADPEQPIGQPRCAFHLDHAVCVTGLAVRNTGADCRGLRLPRKSTQRQVR